MIILGKPNFTQFESTLPGIGPRIKMPVGRYSAKVCITPLTKGEKPFFCRTHDLSMRGVFFISGRQLPNHMKVELRIKTIWGCMRLKGMVVYSILGIGFGCRFINVTSKQRHKLATLMALKNGAPLSARTLASKLVNG